MQADILRKHWKDISFPLPIWYQDGLTKWKSGKLILQGKRYACISPDGPNEISWFPLWRSAPEEPLAFKIEKKRWNPQEEFPVQAMVTWKVSKKHSTRGHRPYDIPTWGQIKTLTNQAENLVSQQGMPRNPENIFVTMLAFASSAQADLINHTYWAYIPNTPFIAGCRMDRYRTGCIH